MSTAGANQPARTQANEAEHAKVREAILTRLRPTDEERIALAHATESLLAHADAICRTMAADGAARAQPLLVGSAAKDTWLHEHVDLDVFLLFPEELGREQLEQWGLEAGNRILEDAEQKYAEHPYVHGTWAGYPADVVPAHAVADPSRIKSAVDRTPYHNRYVSGYLAGRPDLKDDVRLFKAWLQGIGAYGAETAAAGFSGYLCEVLVLEMDGFQPLLAWLAAVPEGARLDPTGGSDARFPNAALTVIDPVDPARNAASAVQHDRLALVRRAAQAYLVEPLSRFFDPLDLPPLDEASFETALGSHGFVGIRFPLPPMREDARVPHLRRAAANLAAILTKDGFQVVRHDGLVRDDIEGILVVETTSPMLPPTRQHHGPPVASGKRAASFLAKYADSPMLVAGPEEVLVDGVARWRVTLREDPRELLARVAHILARGVQLGKHVDVVREAGQLDVVSAASLVQDVSVEPLIRSFFARGVPWERTGDPALDYAPP